MTGTKAVAAGVSGPLVVIAGWLLTKIPWWIVMPMEVQAACLTLVTTSIPAALVYYAPANQHTTDTPPHEDAGV